MEDKRLKQALRALYADGVRPCVVKRRQRLDTRKSQANPVDQLELVEPRGSTTDPYNRRP